MAVDRMSFSSINSKAMESANSETSSVSVSSFISIKVMFDSQEIQVMFTRQKIKVRQTRVEKLGLTLIIKRQ